MEHAEAKKRVDHIAVDKADAIRMEHAEAKDVSISASALFMAMQSAWSTLRQRYYRPRDHHCHQDAIRMEHAEAKVLCRICA